MILRLFRTKLRFLIILAFAILFVIVTFFFIKINRHFSEAVIHSFHQDQIYLVKTLAAGMQQIINHLTQEITHMSALKDLHQDNPQAYERLFKDFYRIFTGRIDSIYKIDQNSQIQYVYPFIKEQIGKDMSNVKCVKDLFRTKKPTISKCFTTDGGAYVLAINYPIFANEKEKNMIGAIRCIIHMDTLTGSFLPIFRMQEKGTIWIIDQEGSIIYHPDPKLLLENYKDVIEGKSAKRENRRSEDQLISYQALKTGLEAWGINSFWGKGTELYAFTPLSIGSKKWLIGITTPYISLYNPIKNNNRNMFFLTLALFGIFSLGGYILHYSYKKRTLLETETEFLKKEVELEEEIKKERDKLHILFDSMADAVLVINDDYQVEFMNQAAISHFGGQIGKRCFQVLSGCDRPCSSCHLGDNDLSTELTLIHCRDTERKKWYEISAAPLATASKKNSLIEIIRDVTKEKELEQKLITSEKKYRTLVTHTNDLIMMQNFQGIVLFISESIENLLGYKIEEFYHKQFQQFLTENPINDPWRKEVHGPKDLQRRLQPHLLECITKYGDKVILEANESLVFNWDGQEKEIMGVYRDITERKRLEEQLLESERLRMLSLTKRFRFGEIIGKDLKMQEIYELVEAVSGSKATVLIQGESGTGKELVARAIHYQGSTPKSPFIGVSCSVLSESLLESELFGHVKGAFTGAFKDKIGRFELADGGALFLDEIGDMSLNLQTKLLRVLQEREFEKVGGEKTIKVNVRIITATNKDLKAEVAEGKFREDLYYRLNVVKIILPPLRERMDDLPLLATHFIEKFNQETGKDINDLSREAIRILAHYPWPGNIRELENVIEHAFVKCNKPTIQTRHLPKDLIDSKMGNIIQIGIKKNLPKDQIEKNILLNALEECDWNLITVMQKLSISRPTLWRRMKKYGLTKKSP